VENDLSKHDKKVEDGEYKSLIEQIDSEYHIAYDFITPKWSEWITRLKIYNNQKRKKEAIGDPLMFTIHQTILASLYDDRLSVKFSGRNGGDEEVAENLNNLSTFDYDEMEKDILDYNWDWDTSFFGRGLVLFNEFNRKLKVPIPEIIDPMTFLRDPRAVSSQGDIKGRGGLRFCGREIRVTKRDLENGGYFDYEDLKDTNKNTTFDTNRNARVSAQGLGELNSKKVLIGENKDYSIFEWITWDNGKLVLVALDSQRKKIIKYVPLDYTKIPIIDRSLFPMAHSWDGTSIPDLTEDKQRARAVVQNVALEGVKAGQYPMHLYDSTKIKNKAQLERYELNKWIPVDGTPSNTIEQVQRQQVKNEVNWIMDVLDASAQRATATPATQQGMITSGRTSATETSIAAQKVDTRYSLSAKIFGWSEKKFWRHWYSLYKKHFKADIDEKIVRINGMSGESWRPFTRENIIATVDPDVKVESKSVSEAKRLEKLNSFGQVLMVLKDSETTNKRYGERHFAFLSGLTEEEINALIPPTIDEMEAVKENQKLNNNEIVKININQNHQEHLMKHSSAISNAATDTHILAHKTAMMMQRDNPELRPQKEIMQEQMQMQSPNKNGSDAKLNFDTPNTLQKVQ